MSVSVQQLQSWMDSPEHEHLEFKEAKQNFHFEKLVKYCAALANEGGGKVILGVTDKRPRRVVGSQAFSDLERTKAGLIERLRLRVDAEELPHPDGRVVVFAVPSRPLGVPVGFDGAYWMRGGEDLVPMTPDLLKRIFDEAERDFSAEVCPEATLNDLDPAAIEQFRTRWLKKSRNEALARLSPRQLLTDAELLVAKGVTYAALILLGKRQALTQFLAQAEVVFEYRSGERAGPANQRDEYRQGFLLFYDKLWETINLRNDRQHFQHGFFMLDVPTFSEGAVREAILNAVAHRDYRHPGSVFIRQYPRRIEIVSPGGFPPGITPDNILDQQLPRNRRIAEAFARCDLVERSGQGANRMFEECIRQSKPLPDFSGSDPYQVWLKLHGEIQDPDFLRFLEKVGEERLRTLSAHEFLVLDLVRREQRIPPELDPFRRRLLDEGLIESMGRGRGVRYFLARQFYQMSGRQGVYTRMRGLDRETNKALLLKHIQDHAAAGAKLGELLQVNPALGTDTVRWMLRELKAEGKAHVVGRTSAARWFPGLSPDQEEVS